MYKKKKSFGDKYSDIYLFKKCSLLHFTSLHVKRNGKGRTKRRRRRRREKKRIDEHASSSSPRRDHRAESATSVPPTHPRREKKSKANDETRGETHRTTKMDGNVDEIVVRQKNTERERRVNDTDDRIRCRDGAARSRTSSRDC